MGKVTIMPETTTDPISLIGRAAGVCWSGDVDDPKANYDRGIDCITSRHGRTFEFPDVVSCLDGYSARVIREWYTHIGGGPTRLQASTRYINYNDIDVYIPDKISNNIGAKEAFDKAVEEIRNSYRIITDLGIPKEDAANILPLGMYTRIVDKRNMRNIMDMSRQRMCSRAYHEYRDLFNDYLTALELYSDEWKTVIDMVMMPKCEELGYCPEKKSCGLKPKKGK